jgi:hypothetical protein
MMKHVKDGKINVSKEGKPVSDDAGIRKELAMAVNDVIEKLAKQALLVG